MNSEAAANQKSMADLSTPVFVFSAKTPSAESVEWGKHCHVSKNPPVAISLMNVLPKHAHTRR
jgi:hypothetical protein